MEKPPPLIVEQSFGVSAEEVWRAITDVDQMRQWYFENISDFRAEVEFEFETRFEIRNEGLVFLHQWKVTEVVPLRKIEYEWTYAGYSGAFLATFELSEQHDQTTLTLTALVLESLPDDVPEFTRESGLTGWVYFITQSLRRFLTEKP